MKAFCFVSRYLLQELGFSRFSIKSISYSEQIQHFTHMQQLRAVLNFNDF